MFTILIKVHRTAPGSSEDQVAWKKILLVSALLECQSRYTSCPDLMTCGPTIKWALAHIKRWIRTLSFSGGDGIQLFSLSSWKVANQKFALVTLPITRSYFSLLAYSRPHLFLSPLNLLSLVRRWCTEEFLVSTPLLHFFVAGQLQPKPRVSCCGDVQLHEPCSLQQFHSWGTKYTNRQRPDNRWK